MVSLLRIEVRRWVPVAMYGSAAMVDVRSTAIRRVDAAVVECLKNLKHKKKRGSVDN